MIFVIFLWHLFSGRVIKWQYTCCMQSHINPSSFHCLSHHNSMFYSHSHCPTTGCFQACIPRVASSAASLEDGNAPSWWEIRVCAMSAVVGTLVGATIYDVEDSVVPVQVLYRFWQKTCSAQNSTVSRLLSYSNMARPPVPAEFSQTCWK